MERSGYCDAVLLRKTARIFVVSSDCEGQVKPLAGVSDKDFLPKDVWSFGLLFEN